MDSLAGEKTECCYNSFVNLSQQILSSEYRTRLLIIAAKRMAFQCTITRHQYITTNTNAATQP